MTDIEVNDCVCALEIAIEQYKRDAATMRESGQPRLTVQFDEQAKRAEQLIEKLSR